MALAGESMRARLDARVQPRILPLFAALSLAFAFFGVVTLVFRPPEATPLLLWVDVAGAIALGVGAVWVSRRPPPPAYANAIVFGALTLALGASLLAIKLLHLPAETTNVLLLELVASIILLGQWWVVAYLTLSLSTWSVVAGSEGWTEPWLNAGFALVVTTIMSVMIQVVRIRDAAEAEALALADAQKAARLEKLYERERAHARDLAAANDSLEAFTYVVSHDLKEPLRGLRVYLEDLGESLPDAGEPRERYDRVVQSERRLDRLVQGLLEWSRTGTTPVETYPVDIVELLHEPTTRQLFDHLLQERRGRLLIDRDIPSVEAAPTLLRQVLGNLILNGLRHNPRANPQIRVYAMPDAPKGFVEIVVEDNGPGYPDTVIRRVEGLKNRPSTVKGGFGLAIARRAAERLGGQLHLSNAEAGGGRAHVVLPVAREGRRKSLSVPL